PLQQLIGLVGEMLTHAILTRDDRLVDMDTGCRLARTRTTNIGRALDAPAHRVVEDEDTIGAERRAHEGFDRGIVDALDFGLVVKALHRGGMTDQLKAFAVEREALRNCTAVKDRDLVRLG